LQGLIQLPFSGRGTSINPAAEPISQNGFFRHFSVAAPPKNAEKTLLLPPRERSERGGIYTGQRSNLKRKQYGGLIAIISIELLM